MSTEAQLVGPYERLVLLRAVSISGNPPVEALAALAQQARERRLKAGTIIVSPAKPLKHVYVVVEGRVGLYQDDQLLYAPGPRDAFGLLEVLAHSEGGLEVRAEVETLLLELRSATLMSVLEDHFIMTLDTIRALGRMLLTTPAWLANAVNRERIKVPEAASSGTLDLVDRIRLLHSSDLFAHTRLDSLEEIAAQYEEVREEPGTVLWREGDPAGWLMVLLDGRIESSSADGLRFDWSRGTVAGTIEALAGVPRWHDAIAATAITGLRLSVERLLDALEDDFDMAADVLAALANLAREGRQARDASRAATDEK